VAELLFYTSTGIAILYLLVAGILFVDAWGCTTSLCNLLIVIWSMPTFAFLAIVAD
jgi:hypothetical protein